ncbi:MAG: hypothetical protein C0505_03630 [Leptothrix sp. (in: Bacteria)]|nr:hypothetical protein [Leptothrix sp. (in: b-proteobacteria)]
MDAARPVRAGVGNGDIEHSYLGLLMQAQSDFDTIAMDTGGTAKSGVDRTCAGVDKWSPRSTDRAERAAQIDAGLRDRDRGAASREHPRPGKRVALWEQPFASKASAARCAVCCGLSSAPSARPLCT